MPDTEFDLPSVYSATYDHIGIILWGKDCLRSNLEQEFEWLGRHPQFKLGWDHEAYAYDFLAENAPEMLEQMRAGLERFRGRLGVGSSTYGQPLSMFIDGESNIRQLTFALEATEKHLGYPMSVYLMSEHPFHAQLPQLLAGCGFKGALLRTHFMMYGHNPEYDAPVGDWVGLDGTRIAAVPTYVGQLRGPLFYNRIPGLTSTLDNRILTDAPSEACPLSLADFRREFGRRVQPLIASRADDVRYREELIQLHENDAWMRWVLLEEIFDLLPQSKAEFRTHPNDFKVRMPWGYCGNWMWNRCRRAEVDVLTAERLAAVAAALGKPVRSNALERAWKGLLVAQHHDIQICGLEDDARKFLTECEEQSRLVVDQALETVAATLGSSGGVAYNPLGWERTGWIETPTFRGAVTLPGLGFRPVPDAGTRPAESLPDFTWQPESKSESLRLLVTQEAVSGRSRVWQYEPVGILTTPFYEVCSAPGGGMRLLRDRNSGQVVLSPPKTSGTFAAMIYGADQVSQAEQIVAEIEPGRALLIETGRIGGIPYRSEWAFYAHTARIDWRGEFHFREEWIGRPKQPLPPGGYRFDREDLADHIVPGFHEHEYKLRLRFFPYLGPHVTAVRDMPFHAAETDQAYLQGLYWAAVSDGHTGLALLNRGQMGCVRESDGAISSVLAFSLPYIWGTRVLNSSYQYELGILPFAGPWQEAGIFRQALEYNFPLSAWSPPKPPPSAGAVESTSAWTPYREEILGKACLSALYEKNGRIFARFAEYGGGQAEVRMDWMGKPVSFMGVDLRERARGSLGSVLRLDPWQVQTICLVTNEGIPV